MSLPFGDQTAHFLLVGLIGSCVTLLAFSFMWCNHRSDRMLHSAACLLAFTSSLSYFATYSGAGIVVKASESPSRDIFWARYVDAFLTACIVTACVLHLTNSSFVSAASILSHVLLCCLAWTIGAVTVAPFKFWWWAAGFTFMSLVALQLRGELRTSSPATARYAGTMAVFAFAWGLTFSLVWLLGQEGAAVMSRALETCLLVLADLALKAGMFGYILFAVESPQDAAGEKELKDRLLSSSRYSTECI